VLSFEVELITGSIAQSARHRYLIYSEANSEVFRFTGATRCSDGVKFGMEEGTKSPLLLWSTPPCQISPPSVQRLGYSTSKLKFLLRFDQNMEYKRPIGAYPLRDFHKTCRVCTLFHDALAVKISLDCSRGYVVMGVLS